MNEQIHPNAYMKPDTEYRSNVWLHKPQPCKTWDLMSTNIFFSCYNIIWRLFLTYKISSEYLGGLLYIFPRFERKQARHVIKEARKLQKIDVNHSLQNTCSGMEQRVDRDVKNREMFSWTSQQTL